jgi:nucleoside phosphorylase
LAAAPDNQGGRRLIRLVVALPAEARPLIRRFGLARVDGGEFPIWHAAETSLVISGVGRAAAASAVACLAGDEPPAEAAWINVGIAGHRALPLGEVVLAHKVADRTGGRAWCPPLVFEPPCATATVTTVDRPETGYPEETVYEMEAAGFCSAAAQFASAELIQVVKVISDNAAAPPDRLTSGRVEELIEARIETIALIIEQTAGLARELVARRTGH